VFGQERPSRLIRWVISGYGQISMGGKSVEEDGRSLLGKGIDKGDSFQEEEECHRSIKGVLCLLNNRFFEGDRGRAT
jgi:hypothetical protein